MIRSYNIAACSKSCGFGFWPELECIIVIHEINIRYVFLTSCDKIWSISTTTIKCAIIIIESIVKTLQ